MKLAWKEMTRNKTKFVILGSIIFLVSFLTFMISGLANGLSQDNASLIKDLPDGTFLMSEDAEETVTYSRIDPQIQEKVLSDYPEAVGLSIQMGFLKDNEEKQQSVAFVASTGASYFEEPAQGEVFLDESLAEDQSVGEELLHEQSDMNFTAAGFVKQTTYSHSPVAFISLEDYEKMFRAEEMQLLFVPGEETVQAAGLQSFSKANFLDLIPSYSAEQLSLNMIVWFLVVISGLLFAIFFYMMNVQKIKLYGILKGIGVKTSTLFRMMWMQMMAIALVSLALSALLSQGFTMIAPANLPFSLPVETTLLLSVVFLAVGFVGATLSGIQIKKVEPLQAIQQGEV
ncbi:ABC transporter permease [Jeotgalibacillus sp. S-D1]|uniref:FtsX-like permease family protein n=1 Tax=Jeotgalibacillus sp. S-D1 TaxID=2552189 RepID=UPI00105A8251|nr:FtsX-like permease family protein [Jeotgalibacillus sp. S-D1]TDL32824.1 ABC transporter permease [Jeotgalibacillus sp. S-D1]